MHKIKSNYAVKKYESPEGRSLFLDDEEQLCGAEDMECQEGTIHSFL